ncbi:hypothetical protein FRX31_013657 [Thalictrum thalictroides]|uniref:Uncharacterized protein n=1 Tax=Thalictrum thalictroides TaxID=46969 RepID=A0A7J6WKY1_THATH|nr:hypothetical protein FRX31_013657 [Thalictrum thalictroides]
MKWLLLTEVDGSAMKCLVLVQGFKHMEMCNPIFINGVFHFNPRSNISSSTLHLVLFNTADKKFYESEVLPLNRLCWKYYMKLKVVHLLWCPVGHKVMNFGDAILGFERLIQGEMAYVP